MATRIALFGIVCAVLVAAGGFALLYPTAPAATRLAGVEVGLVSRSVDSPSPGGGSRLTVTVSISSARPLSECLRFALDEPTANRLLSVSGGDPCVRPRGGTSQARLVFDHLTDFDTLVVQSHTLLWGAEGGRCGPFQDLIGTCSLDTVGRMDVSWPIGSPLPSFVPLPSLSFGPLFSFDPGQMP